MAKVTGKTPAMKAGKTLQRPAKARSMGFVTSGPIPSDGFLAKTRLKKAGGSLVMTVPAPARNLLHLTEGQEMAVTVEGSRVVMEPMRETKVRPPKYTLEELLAQCDFDAPYSDEERAWLDEPPMGREIL